jgi:hypothetical protein
LSRPAEWLKAVAAVRGGHSSIELADYSIYLRHIDYCRERYAKMEKMLHRTKKILTFIVQCTYYEHSITAVIPAADQPGVEHERRA